ncbi:MAG: KH domain-containing protein [Candidatus Portnoybacteria bacterium]|nr:KH domain-containing protein [Candidatus Portnoybacteria bacterium]
MNNEFKETLEVIVKETLLKMDFEGEISFDSDQQDLLILKIKSEEAGLLIGKGGETMAALQHLIRAIVSKKIGASAPNFIIDVNDYRYNQIESLRERAQALAKEAILEGRSKILEPMSSYERRIVHLALRDVRGIKTESEGEGLLRRVVIKPDAS